MSAKLRDFPFFLGPGFKVSLNRPLPHSVNLCNPRRRREIDRMVKWCKSEEAGLEGYFQCCTTLTDNNPIPFDMGGWAAWIPDPECTVIFRFSHVRAAHAFRSRYPR